MTLRFDGQTYFSRMWFLDSPGVDWLAALYRKPGDPWMFVYRFRYDAHGDQPEQRSWYEVTLRDLSTATECLAELKPMMDIIGTQMAEGMGGNLHTLVLETADPVAALAALKDEAWCRFRAELLKDQAQKLTEPTP